MPYVLPLVLLAASGVTQVVRANLLQELDSSQVLQSASAGNLEPPAGIPAPQVPSEPNTGEGLTSSSDEDVAVSSGPPQPDNTGRNIGSCSNNGPLLNLAPGAYIQFKVAVPPGFLARMDDTPDGGKTIVVISPEPPCPKCGVPPYGSSSGSATNTFDGAAPPPQGIAGNMIINEQNYQDSAQMVQRTGQGPSSGGSPPPNYPQQYLGPDQSVSSEMVMKNSAYRKVQVGTTNHVPYQARNGQNFPLPPPPQPQPSFQRSVAPPPSQFQPMTQRMVSPPPQYQQPMSPSQYQQPQYSEVNSALEFQQPAQQQGFIQQTGSNSYQQQSQQFQPQLPGQPLASLEKFHTALRSLDDGDSDQIANSYH